MWLLTLLIALDDVRVVPTLEALAADPKRLHAVIHRENAKQLAETLATIKAVTPKAADEALIARADEAIAKAKPHPDADPAQLFAKVYADPTDDAIRAVLADLLTERGDPRGEFIALQLARHATKGTLKAEERALLAEADRALDRVAAPPSARAARGRAQPPPRSAHVHDEGARRALHA